MGEVICVFSMIWGSHGSEYEDGCILGCSAMWSGSSLPDDGGGSKSLWNFGKLLPDKTVLQPGIQPAVCVFICVCLSLLACFISETIEWI
jgi:hypothetical protein